MYGGPARGETKNITCDNWAHGYYDDFVSYCLNIWRSLLTHASKVVHTCILIIVYPIHSKHQLFLQERAWR